VDALWVIEAHQSAWQLSYWIQNAIFQVSTYRGIPYQRQSPTTVWENVAEAEVRPSRVRWSNLREDFEMLIWRSSSHPSVPTLAIAFLHPACCYFMREAHICVRASRVEHEFVTGMSRKRVYIRYQYIILRYLLVKLDMRLSSTYYFEYELFCLWLYVLSKCFKFTHLSYNHINVAF